MKRFTFRLETPLNIKVMAEQQQKAVVAGLKDEYETSLKNLAELQETWKQFQEKLRQTVGSEDSQPAGAFLDIHKLNLMQSYIPVLTQKILSQQEEIKQAEARLAGARETLTRIMRDRKVLDKLREKALRMYHRELNREDQKNSDEMAAVGFMRER